MDFEMRYDRWARPLASLFGMGPRWSRIRVADGTLHVRYGWAFRIDVPVADIKSARRVSERPLAWGVHQAKDGWLVNGSRHNIVEVRFARPVKPKRVPPGGGGLWGWDGPIRSLYLSPTEPDGFIAAVQQE